MRKRLRVDDRDGDNGLDKVGVPRTWIVCMYPSVLNPCVRRAGFGKFSEGRKLWADGGRVTDLGSFLREKNRGAVM